MTGVDLVLIGHTPDQTPRWARRNVLCIDTGVHVDECAHMTIAEIGSRGEPRLHRFAREDHTATS